MLLPPPPPGPLAAQVASPWLRFSCQPRGAGSPTGIPPATWDPCHPGSCHPWQPAAQQQQQPTVSAACSGPPQRAVPQSGRPHPPSPHAPTHPHFAPPPPLQGCARGPRPVPAQLDRLHSSCPAATWASLPGAPQQHLGRGSGSGARPSQAPSTPVQAGWGAASGQGCSQQGLLHALLSWSKVTRPGRHAAAACWRAATMKLPTGPALLRRCRLGGEQARSRSLLPASRRHRSQQLRRERQQGRPGAEQRWLSQLGSGRRTSRAAVGRCWRADLTRHR